MSDFPDDLISIELELRAARCSYSEWCAALPANASLGEDVAALEWVEGDPPLGQTAEQAATTERLRGRVVELAAAVLDHPFWQGLAGPELVQARAVLKQVDAGAGVGAGGG